MSQEESDESKVDLQPVEQEEPTLANFLLQALAHNTVPEPLQYASDELLGDRGFILQAAAQHYGHAALHYASEALRNDRDFVLQVVGVNELAFRYAPECLRSDGDFVMLASQQDGRAFRWAADWLRSDKDFALKAIARDWRAFGGATKKLRVRTDFVRQAVARNGHSLTLARPQLQSNLEMVEAALASGTVENVPEFLDSLGVGWDVARLVALKIGLMSGRATVMLVFVDTRCDMVKGEALQRLATGLDFHPIAADYDCLFAGHRIDDNLEVMDWLGLQIELINEISLVGTAQGVGRHFR
mmetsp:Transcript_45358/g.82858  ORF Transcript_45358/g.82858 Transcript_45358/m.82858 type:complete len:300 (-) Transcript_45358:41-940(-)